METTRKRRSIQVVLTREEKAAVKLSTRIRELGFRPIIFPTVQFTRVYSDYTGPQNFSGNDWIVFPTTRAVQYFFKRFRQRIDPAVKICAVNEKVNGALEKLNYNAHAVLKNGSANTLQEHFENEKPGHLVYPCSKSNAQFLAQILGPKGFKVKDLALYTTEPPVEVDDSKLEIIRKGYYDIITFASASAVKHLMMILRGKVGVFKNKVAIVLGKEIKKLLVGSSFKELIVTPKANEDSMVEALVKYRENN